MKKIIISSLVLLSFLGFTSCSEDKIDTYNDTDNIYFSYAAFPGITSGSDIVADSTGFSFNFDNASVKQRIYRIPIRVQGKISTKDRNIKVTVDPMSTAIEGTHYSLPKDIVMRAGKVVDTLDVTVFRTPEMKANTFTLVLNLEENDFFTTKMKTKVINVLTKKTISFTRFKLSFDDKLAQPPGWFTPFFGAFTAKKFFLMCNLMNLKPVMFNQKLGAPGLAIPEMQYYQNFMKRYLADQKAAGNTIYEEDNTEMFFP
ncbi:DUF4843 domain-containing protein [Flavobacterium sp.]|uniref:DUF4843 domain-containing protein n=1 Tax=Flavobacterium sp. TaxID=239 RepID=UPI002623FCBF|nr:DUF4843 domain-containing protein [Flavobacterium sp.]